MHAAEEKKIIFFQLDHGVSDWELVAEYEKRNLKPADPLLLSAFCKRNPLFSEYPVVTYCDDDSGFYHWKWDSFLFEKVGSRVTVKALFHINEKWSPGTTFACVRKGVSCAVSH